MATVRSATRNEGGRPPVYALSDFGKRLKRRLDQRGWSRNTLSRETGINASTLWRWMVGKASPPVDKVVEIASTVGCRPADLISCGRPRKRTPTPWGKRVDDLAAQRCLTRRELAERVGISPVSLWQFLMGKARPRLETAGRMADVLGVPLDKLR